MPDGRSIPDFRIEYARASLSKADLASSPIVQLQDWIDEARSAEEREHTAMTLSTISENGHPSARLVLLKGIDERGLQFFTNLESRKGRELKNHPSAALTFWWPTLERQVRVEGKVETIDRAEVETYFDSRPLESKIGAWASPQSQSLKDRRELEARLEASREMFVRKEIPTPPHWGGFRVLPDRVEFWQGRPNRLHDRMEFSLTDTNGWQVTRLAP